MNTMEKGRVKKVIYWLLSQGIVESQAQLADMMGYNSSSFSQIVKGEKPVSNKFVKNLCKISEKINETYLLDGSGCMILDSNPDWQHHNISVENIDDIKELREIVASKDADISRLVGQNTFLENQLNKKDTTKNTYSVPLIPFEAAAGFPFGELDGVKYEDCEQYVIPEFENKGVTFMIRVSGSSMYPKYSSGDLLGCKRIDDILFFQWGKIYVIDSSQGPLVKRVFEHEDPDMILLVSDNKEKYPPFPMPKSDIRSLSLVLGVIRME